MPTPIRVRGKKGNKRRIVESTSSKRAKAQKASAKTHGLRQKPLSILERFPTEILQDIFVLSTNMNLPLVSSTLLAKLDSDHVKKRIVISAFAHGEVTEHTLECGECCGAESWLEDSCDEASFQSDVMRRRWFTHSFFDNCREFYFQQQAKKAVAYFECNHCNRGRTNVVSDLEGFLRKRGDPHACPDKQPKYTYFADPEDEKGPKLDIQFAQVSTDGKPLGLTVQVDPDVDHEPPTPPYTSIARRFTLFLELRMPFVCTDTQIPNRLLRGPWTDDKLRLLRMVLEGSESRAELFEAYDETLPQYDTTIASEGLEEAIRGYCAPAMAMLAKPRWDEWYVEFYVNTRGIPDTDLRNFPLEISKYCNSEVDVDTSLFQDLHGSQLGVMVREKHLIAALEAAEHHGDPDAKVYNWLLPLAMLQQYHDPRRRVEQQDVYVLAEWLIRKKIDEEARGIKDGLGAKALKKLDHEQSFVRTLFRDFVLDTQF